MILVSFGFASSYANLRPGNTLVFQPPFACSAPSESFPSRYRDAIRDWTQTLGATEASVVSQNTEYDQRTPIPMAPATIGSDVTMSTSLMFRWQRRMLSSSNERPADGSEECSRHSHLLGIRAPAHSLHLSAFASWLRRDNLDDLHHSWRLSRAEQVLKPRMHLAKSMS